MPESSTTLRRPFSAPRHWATDGPYAKWTGTIPSSSPMSAYKFSYASSAGLQLRVIEELVDTDGSQPCVLARQAALYHAFGDVVGAHRAATKAQQAASQPDHEFDTWVADLAAEVDAFRQKVDEAFNAAPGAQRALEPRPLLAYKTTVLPVSSVKVPWEGLRDQGHVPAAELLKRLSRLISIESSRLGGVFELGGHSVPRLVRAGFFDGAIEGVEMQEKRHIIRVLQDYHSALKVWGELWAASKQLDERMLMEVHHRLLRATRLRVTDDGGLNVIPTRVWRATPAINSQYPRATQHCHPNTIPDTILQVLREAEPLIAAARTAHMQDPYSAAAWLHHALLSISPFQDGNGRLTRIVASIPLVLSGLPPINIFSSDRAEYYDAIAKADHDADLGPLATLLHSQAIKTVSVLDAICLEGITAEVDDTGDGLDNMLAFVLSRCTVRMKNNPTVWCNAQAGAPCGPNPGELHSNGRRRTAPQAAQQCR